MYTMNEKVVPVYIEDEMKNSYIDYAMSVIVGRALPDVRDGLKPVHRRILYAMKDLNLEHNKQYKKTARIVGECFVKDTLILTHKGLIPIQDIKIGDLAYTQRGKETVTQLYEMPAKPLLKITLENGISNVATPSQKIKTLNKNLEFEWKETRELKPDDVIVVRACFPDIKDLVKLDASYPGLPRYLNKEISYLLGLLISDGWIEKPNGRSRNRMFFYSTERNVIEKAQAIFRQLFYYEPTIETKMPKGSTKEGKPYKKGYQIRISRHYINDFFMANFHLEGKKALTKEIPAQIFASPKEVIFSFVAGLIEGDGSIHNKRNIIHYGSISERLIDGLMILLQHLGIFSTKYTEQNKDISYAMGRQIWGRNRFYYLEFRGSNALLLSKNINLFDQEKENRLKKISNGKMMVSNYDIIPYAGEHIFQELSAKHIGSGWYSDINGNKFRMGIKYPAGCKIRYSSDLMEKPLRKSQIMSWGIRDKLQKIGSPLSNFVEDTISKDVYFLKVSAIEGMPSEKTFDIQVENEHEFIANGMVVHNCLGKYHPHGDVAVYDALVRMVQDFSLRYPLIDGQGNFGSVDGDAPAAMRYTEARMAAIADEMLSDIEKETVRFVPNFDETLVEPTVLPARLPNLLINGSSGIAVGMATNIPPHNLGEIVDSIVMLIDNPDASLNDLMKIVKGPDFPTGGIICGREGIVEAYKTGKGILKLHAKAFIEEQKSGREHIIISELPYQVNKANLIESIAGLVQSKRIEGISDVRDESDKDGMRVVIELKRDQNSQVILNQLYKHTQLQTTFGIIMLALVDRRPRILNLKQVLLLYIDHRKDIIIKRTTYDLNKAQERAHILEGLKIALSNIDKIVKLIRSSKTTAEAKSGLISNFSLSDRQAQAILEMQLQRLTSLEREKIEEEYLDLIKKIEFYNAILASEKKVLSIIKEELAELKKRFSDERRSEIVAAAEDLEIEDLIAEEDVVITISHSGYIKRLPVGSYRKQRRGGKGVTGLEMKEEDFVEHLFIASTHEYILFFTDKGRVYWLKVHEVPQAGRIAKGKAIINMLGISQGESISALVIVKEFSPGKFIIMATKQGIVKKTRLEAYSHPKKKGIIAIGLKADDELIKCELTDGEQEILLATKLGKAIRFPEEMVRDVGRSACGVKGISLGKKDEVIGMEVVKPDATLLTVAENGFGKRTLFSQYRSQGRGGKGVINIKTTKRNGEVVSVRTVVDDDDLMMITQEGMIVRCSIKDIRTIGRSTQGVKLISLGEKDKVVSVARLAAKDEEGEEEEKE